jgi:hypothetical protein
MKNGSGGKPEPFTTGNDLSFRIVSAAALGRSLEGSAPV